MVARWRAGGVDAQGLLTASDLQEAPLPPLPASTSFVTLDKDGNAVACVAQHGQPVRHRAASCLGSASCSPPRPQWCRRRCMPPAIAWNENTHAFHAAVAGSGQEGAPIAVAVGMLNALRTNRPMAATVPDPGRANVIECSRYLPGENGSCAWASDPRDAGLAVGGS